MKTKKILIGLIGLIVILSCEKNNDSDTNEIKNYQKHAKLKRVLLYSSVDSKEPINIVDEYKYDSLNRVCKVSSPMYENGEITGIIKYDSYEYNIKGELAKIFNFNANTNSPIGFINLKNYIYTYSSNGIKEKELIEYPQINSYEYSMFKYSNTKLVKVEKYDDKDILETFTIYEYNNLGELTKEISYTSDDIIISVTNNTYDKGLNILTEVYSGNNENKIREINKTYDSNGNLIMIESNELKPYSSLISHVMRYEYYEE